MPRSLLAGQAAGRGPLLRRSEHHHAVRAEIRTEIDQVVNVLPAALSQFSVGGGHVKALWADHKPVQTNEYEALGLYDVAVFAALRRTHVRRTFGEGKW